MALGENQEEVGFGFGSERLETPLNRFEFDQVVTNGHEASKQTSQSFRSLPVEITTAPSSCPCQTFSSVPIHLGELNKL